jgi:hypothetical protein
MVVVMPHHRKASSAVKGVRLVNSTPYAASVECGPYVPKVVDPCGVCGCPKPCPSDMRAADPLPVAIVVRKPDSHGMRLAAVGVGMLTIVAALILAMAGAGCAGVGL